jgi:hypothetical protein
MKYPQIDALRLKRELDRIQKSLYDKKVSAEHRNLLYVAQQVLTWAINPKMAARPHKVIMGDKAGHL